MPSCLKKNKTKTKKVEYLSRRFKGRETDGFPVLSRKKFKSNRQNNCRKIVKSVLIISGFRLVKKGEKLESSRLYQKAKTKKVEYLSRRFKGRRTDGFPVLSRKNSNQIDKTIVEKQ